MIEITIDGKKVEVAEGSMVMQAAQEAGLYIPHFCYHKKLSIAANCRMCLVEVEKAPKPLPACATPCSNGMVVFTQSKKAIQAQKDVMEFLLINHPLDCPICDQGGECQLQDLAVGYGGVKSRYTEEKRVVFRKNLGSLVSAEEMSRCIQCTRCVRFGQEIAGMMELGMLNRGEHSEITSFVGRSVVSELSGNMIDICPVGALTSKPFRYAARTWELARRKSISPHDSVGANLVVQVKGDEVVRVVPHENEAVNECWISDRDRFSYEALNSNDRLTSPMVKEANGEWRKATWEEALGVAAGKIHEVINSHGSSEFGSLATAQATVEELALLAKVTRSLRSENIDFRLRQMDSNFDQEREGTPWLGTAIETMAHFDQIVVIGSNLRNDHPLFAQRLRQGCKHGAQISSISTYHDDPFMPLAHQISVAPSSLPQKVGELAVALANLRNAAIPERLKEIKPCAETKALAQDLANAQKAAIYLGNFSVNHPHATDIIASAQWITEMVGEQALFGYLTEGANTVGGYLAQAVPGKGGKTAAAMLRQSLKAYVVLHAEPHLDSAAGANAIKTLQGAEVVIALTSYQSAAKDWATVMLPVAPYTETSGTFVNAEGRVQSFKGVVKPLGETRPAWKVLRVLGNALNLADFTEESTEEIRDHVLTGSALNSLNNRVRCKPGIGKELKTLERAADVPMVHSDVLVRRAEALQATPGATAPKAYMNTETLKAHGLQDREIVKVKSFSGSVELAVSVDPRVPDGVIKIATAHPATQALGSVFGEISVERKV